MDCDQPNILWVPGPRVRLIDTITTASLSSTSPNLESDGDWHGYTYSFTIVFHHFTTVRIAGQLCCHLEAVCTSFTEARTAAPSCSISNIRQTRKVSFVDRCTDGQEIRECMLWTQPLTEVFSCRSQAIPARGVGTNVPAGLLCRGFCCCFVIL
jgi:hypothetical protein